MPTGKVRFYDPTKGFGFIQSEDGGEVYVHESVVPAGATLRSGMRVSFSMVDGRKGPQVLQLEILDDPAPITRRSRKDAEALVPIVEDLIRMLDEASGPLRRGKYPENSANLAQVLRAVAQKFGE